MRETPPGPKKDLARLRQVTARRRELDAEWIALARRLRAYNPPVPLQTVAVAAGLKTDAGIIHALRRADAADARAGDTLERAAG